ncbi:FMN-binding negative transcriptional regulator [Xylophilus sp. GW821-FHT01B05]
MYLPAHFEEKDLALLHDAVARSPLGALVTLSDAGLDANQLPFEWDRCQGGLGVLRCHVARANAVWQYVAAMPVEALVVFQGPSAYVSPSLYPSKQDTHQVVPTYNYQAVNVHGRVTVHEDARWLRGLVGRLTRRFEAGRDAPWAMADAPRDYIDDMLTKIVGLEIAITRVEGKWKLSQNRTAADQQGVVAGLGASASAADREVAEVMRGLAATPPA